MATKKTKIHHCCHCGKDYTKLRNNFYTSRSPIWKGIVEEDGDILHYMPICKNCLNKLYEEYTEDYKGDTKQALIKICQQFDIYYNDMLYESSLKGRGTIVSTYCAKVNSMVQYKDKTYEDYILEKQRGININKINRIIVDTAMNYKEDDKKKEKDKNIVSIKTSDSSKPVQMEITQEIKDIFGEGYEDEDYALLYKYYHEWMENNECNTLSQKRIMKELAFTEYEMYTARIRGQNLEPLIKRYRELMDAGGLSPKQQSKDAFDSAQTLGTLIQKFENEDPIDEPEERFKDVDGIGRYISVFFFGHLLKSLGIKRASTDELYNRVMEKFTVNRVAEETDEEKSQIMDALFGTVTDDD